MDINDIDALIKEYIEATGENPRKVYKAINENQLLLKPFGFISYTIFDDELLIAHAYCRKGHDFKKEIQPFIEEIARTFQCITIKWICSIKLEKLYERKYRAIKIGSVYEWEVPYGKSV